MSTSVKICVNLTGLHHVAKEEKEVADNAIWFMIRGIKGSLCSFEEEIQTQIINIYKVNEVLIQTQTYVFP